MFRCERCGECPPARTPGKKVVVQKVNHLHPERPRAQKKKVIQRNGKPKMVWVPDMGGWGKQIAAEMRMCPPCASAWERGNATR